VRAFAAKLERALTATGAEPRKQVFHFAILLNTVRTDGAGPQWARDVYHALVHRYFVATASASDIVSFAPYQLRVRDNAIWNLAFEPAERDRLFRAVPITPEQPAEGNDVERAVLEAIGRTQTATSTVYIVLSDSEASQPASHIDRRSMGQYAPGWSRAISTGSVRLADSGRIMSDAPDAQGKPVPVALYYRIYLPSGFTALGALDREVRPDPRDALWPEDCRGKPCSECDGPGCEAAMPRPDCTGKPCSECGGIGCIKVQSQPDCMGKRCSECSGPGCEDGPNWALLVVALLVLLGGSGIVYWRFLTAPRPIRVRFAGTDMSADVRYGRPTSLGGTSCDVVLSGIPENTKVAQLEVTSIVGSVQLRGVAPYVVRHPKEPVQVGTASVTVLLEAQPYELELEIRRVS
jgi:hypothetical protein